MNKFPIKVFTVSYCHRERGNVRGVRLTHTQLTRIIRYAQRSGNLLWIKTENKYVTYYNRSHAALEGDDYTLRWIGLLGDDEEEWDGTFVPPLIANKTLRFRKRL